MKINFLNFLITIEIKLVSISIIIAIVSVNKILLFFYIDNYESERVEWLGEIE